LPRTTTGSNYLQPYEDVIESVKRLSEKRLRLGITSQEYGQASCEISPLARAEYLDRRAIFISDQTGISKANPKCYCNVSQKLGVPPERCMHVGDRPDRDVDRPTARVGLRSLNRRSAVIHETPRRNPAGLHNP